MGILASIILFSVVFGTFVFIVSKRKQLDQYSDAIVVVKETMMTLAFGLLMWAEAVLLCVQLITAVDAPAYTAAFSANMYAFLAASAILGSCLCCYSLIKRIAVYSDRVVYVSMWGRVETFTWEEIASVKLTQAQRLKVFCKNDDKSFVMGGCKAGFKSLIRIANKKLKGVEGKDALTTLMTRYKLI